MDSWRTLFSQEILNRGRVYYKAGKAKKLYRDEDPEEDWKAVFSATVRGGRNYKVEIEEDTETITRMSCTCPYAEDGAHCKHEAAVLYAIEDEYYKLYAPSKKSSKSASGKAAGAAAGGKKTESGAAGAGKNVQSDAGRSGKNGAGAVKMHPASLPALDELQQQEAAHRREQAEADPSQIQYEPGDYHYFHPENFENGLHVTPAVRKKAEEILHAGEESSTKKKPKKGYRIGHYYYYPEEDEETGGLENFKVVTGFPNGDESGSMLGEASATINKGYYQNRVSITFDQNRLVRASCGDWGCGRKTDSRSYLGYNLCEHELALLLKTEEYLKSNNVGDATSSSGITLLNQLLPMASEQAAQAPAAGDADASAPAVVNTAILRLEPHVERSGDHLSAAFYIGSEKLYKIKDLSSFVQAMKQQKTMTFGTKTELPMGRQFLKEGQSRDWYDFIRKALDEIDQREDYFSTRGGSYWPQNELKANLPLFGRSLDTFAALAGDTPFEYWNKALPAKEGKKDLRVQDARPRIQLEVHAMTSGKKGAGETMDGIRLSGNVPSFLQGQDYLYYVDGSHFNRVSQEESEKIAPLLKIMNDGKIDVRIGRSKLADFYHKVLPQLRQMADVTEYDTDRIAQFIPPEPSFTAYFDTENQSVLCRLEVSYGPQIYSVTDVADAYAAHKALEPSFRDADREGDYLLTANRYLPQYDNELHILFCQKSDEEVFELLDHGLAELGNMGEVRMTQRFQALGIRRHVTFSMGVSVTSNLLDLTMSSDDLTEDEMYQILYQYQRKRRFVKLKDGTFFKLENNETVENLLQIMETLQVPLKEFVKGKMELPAYRALYLDRMLEGTEDLYATRDRRFKELIKEFKTVEDADFEVPASLQKVLRKYQKDGYRWLRTLDQYGFGGILADEMGLGKTLQVIAVLLAFRLEHPGALLEQKAETPKLLPGLTEAAGGECAPEDAGTKGAESGTVLPAVRSATDSAVRSTVTDAGSVVTNEGGAPSAGATSLVICPASLVYNWEEEIHRFAPALQVAAVAGNAAERHIMIHECGKYDVLVTSYDLLKRDIVEYEGITFRFEIIDEAQYIKNANTAAAKCVKLIRAKTRYALTGTPIENRLSELWSIFDYLMPGFLYDYPQFQGTFEIPIAQDSDRARERLRRMVAPFILRRRKEDVLKDLPEKLEEVRYVALEGKQLQLYDAQVMKMKADLKDQSDVDFRKGKIEILAELTKIRQLCCDPALCYSNYDGPSAKRAAVMDMIRTLLDEGHRALVFSQFTSMLELLEQDLQKEGIPYYKITGSTPKARRMELVRAFNANQTVSNGNDPAGSKPIAAIAAAGTTEDTTEAEPADNGATEGDGNNTATESKGAVGVMSMTVAGGKLPAVKKKRGRPRKDAGTLPDSLPAVVDTGTHGPGVNILLMSLKAGGTGLNLTGADVVIHYDPWWNTAAEDQATDRAHRIGQKKVVTVYKVIARGTIEDRIMEMQNRKKDLADQVLSGEGISSSNISREDLMEILE